MLTMVFDQQQAMAQMAELGTEIPAKMQPAQAALGDLSDTLQGLGTDFGQLGTDSEAAGESFHAAGTGMRGEMYEARDATELLGEAIGVRLPRAVGRFVAELPGIGETLNTAFSALAVIFLVEWLIKAAEAISKWTADTFIFTEAMKASNATIAATNKSILEQVDAYNKAQKALEEFGLVGSALTQSKIDDLTSSINKNKESVRDAENQLYGLRNGFVDVTGSAADSENKINLLTSTIKTQTEQLALLQSQHDAQQTAEIIKAEEERIAAAKTASSARITVAESEALLKLAITGGNYSQILGVENKANEDQLKLEVSAIAQRISALTFEGDKTKGERQQLNANIEKLIDDHNNKIRAIYAKAFDELRQLGKEPIPLVTEAPPEMDTISNAVTKGFQQAEQAAQSLGVTLQTNLHSGLASTFDAYEKLVELQKVGIVTQQDLDNGYKQLVKSELNYAIATGASAEAVKKLADELRQLILQEIAHAKASGVSLVAIERMQKELTSLEGTIGKSKGVTKDYLAQLDQDLRNGAGAWVQFKDVVDAMLAGMEAGIATSFAAMIQGQESFGEAMMQATFKLIGSIAQHYADFYIALGLATIWTNPAAGAGELAGGAALEAVAGIMNGLGSASSKGGSTSAASSGSAGPAANSPNVNSQQPTQVVNVTHLASGGLVTGPTLAVIGDSSSGGSAREAVIPLDNGSVMKQIAQALASQMKDLGGQGEIHIHLQSDIPYVAKVLSQGSRDGSIRLYATHARNGTALSK